SSPASSGGASPLTGASRTGASHVREMGRVGCGSWTDVCRDPRGDGGGGGGDPIHVLEVSDRRRPGGGCQRRVVPGARLPLRPEHAGASAEGRRGEEIHVAGGARHRGGGGNLDLDSS